MLPICRKNLIPAILMLPVFLFFTGVVAYAAVEGSSKEVNLKAEKVLVIKSESKMYLLRDGIRFKEYHVSLGDNPVGPKQQEGDERTPEGHYVIDYRNPKSKYHLSLHISYPNKVDRKKAKQRGVSPGGDIFIHGLPNGMSMLKPYFINENWTDGCIAVTNDEIEEIWKLVDNGIPIEISP